MVLLQFNFEMNTYEMLYFSFRFGTEGIISLILGVLCPIAYVALVFMYRCNGPGGGCDNGHGNGCHDISGNVYVCCSNNKVDVTTGVSILILLMFCVHKSI